MSRQVFSWCLVFTEVSSRQIYRLGMCRVRGDKEDQRSSLEHDPESTINDYPPESRLKAVESHKKV